jgi:hypothetical protein
MRDLLTRRGLFVLNKIEPMQLLGTANYEEKRNKVPTKAQEAKPR